MKTPPDPGVADLAAIAKLAEAALDQDPEAIGGAVRALMASPKGGFFEAPAADWEIVSEISHGGCAYGCYALSGRVGGYGEIERRRLAALAALTGRLLHVRVDALRRERELSEAEQDNRRQAQMLDQIHESVITMDLAGYITSWNRSAEQLFGYSAEEAVGRNILFLYVDESDEDLQFHDAFLEHGGREMEVRRRRKSGEVFWASLSLSLMRDSEDVAVGLIGYLSDITDRLAAAESLRLHASIFEHSDEGILITDADERIVSVNNAFCRITGYSREEVLDRPSRMFDSAHQDEDFYRHMREEISTSGNWRGEMLELKKNGEVYPKWASVSAMKNPEGRVTHYFSIFSDISERKRAEERINHLAYYDALTGLPNRSLLHRLVTQTLAAAQRSRAHGALLFIDLNRFKPINDTLGHDVGDRLLKQVGERFRATLRTEDVMARLGGDEFVAGLFNIAKREHAGVVAQKLLASLDEPFLIDGNELRLGASIGISIYPQDGSNTETLLRYADVAMYRAKQANQNGYMYYSEEMNRRSLDRLKIETGLRQALDRGELLVHYQPKVNIASGEIIGAEALVRWRHPTEGMIPPNEFIPVAEETGLVVQIGEWVLEQACLQARIWQRTGLPLLKIAVNISARQITAGLPRIITALLARHCLSPEWLELELTESMLMHGSDGVIDMMDELHAMGIALALDDFGTGFSSLSYLKRFPIDTLKIDRSFVAGIPQDASDCAIAGAIVSMAKQLGHKVIAEGVESHDQLAFLTTLGCDEIQGYLFSPGVPVEEFVTLVRAGRRLGDC
ncbi:MAG TPA: EAL domain-containing protein [Rhodocyclaceae bacterium]|nr:EAL domain-containing protein [Rhodocyclaceae bacterium]